MVRGGGVGVVMDGGGGVGVVRGGGGGVGLVWGGCVCVCLGVHS